MRKQLVIITMAVLALLTAQCKKNEPKPGEKVMVPITGTVDFGGSKTEITTTGCINPVVGDKIYIYHSGQNVGYVNCTATSGQQFSYSGEIDENCLGTNCTFMYLGSGSTDAAGNSIDGSSTTISFADQTSVSVTDGKIANMNKFHVGSCTATVSQEGTVTLSMLSKMAIAYFQLKDDSGSPIANKNVTISGLSATATINKTDGSLTGNSGNITVKTDANGSFYMALIPQGGPVEFAFIFAGYEGTRAFSNGIRECNFYSEQGLGSPLQVTLTKVSAPGEFSVSSTTTVKFSPGNLYYNGADGNKMNSNLPSGWNFYEHQYDCYPSETALVTSTKEINLFTWGYGNWSTINDITSHETNDTMEDWGTALPSAGEGKTWRTLSKDEWVYLINTRSGNRFAKAKVSGVQGLLIFPDTYSGTTSGTGIAAVNTANAAYPGADILQSTWTSMESAGVVFLPAAGYRDGRYIYSVGSYGYYWSGTPNGSESAYSMYFYSGNVNPQSNGNRIYGNSVRLVRDL